MKKKAPFILSIMFACLCVAMGLPLVAMAEDECDHYFDDYSSCIYLDDDYHEITGICEECGQEVTLIEEHWGEMIEAEKIDKTYHLETIKCEACGEQITQKTKHVPSIVDSKKINKTYHKASYLCDECGYSYEKKEKHDWDEWEITKEATCGKAGYKERYCYTCDAKEKKKIPATGKHDWGSWEVTRKATHYRKGIKTRVCLVCDKEQRKSIPKKKLTSNQKKAVKVVNAYMKAAKSYNVNKMDSCFKKGSKKYGYPVKEINGVFKKYNKKIKWTVVDVTGKGKTITVKVRVTRPNFYKQSYDAFYEAVEWAIYHPNASENTLSKKLFGKYRSKVKNCTKKTSTDTVTFKIVKTGKKWKIKKQTRTLVDIATAFYWEGADDAYDAVLDDYS